MARNRKPNGQNPDDFDPDRGTYSEEAAVAWVEPPHPLHVAARPNIAYCVLVTVRESGNRFWFTDNAIFPN